MSAITITANLCKCTKCNTVLIDENPQSGSIELEIPDNAYEMEFLHDDYGGSWVCPKCHTDGFLIDL